MRYKIVQKGESRSFPKGDSFLYGSAECAEIVMYLGMRHESDTTKAAILIELGTECLGVHTGEDSGREGSNVLGFARFRNGMDRPSNLIELVRQPETLESAITAAANIFEDAGLVVSVCADQAGRIIDRLVRPKYNNALSFLDEGLANASDMDLTCRLGLGYPDGLIERVTRGGLEEHYEITSALFEIYGTPAYAPARRSVVAKRQK